MIQACQVSSSHGWLSELFSTTIIPTTGTQCSMEGRVRPQLFSKNKGAFKSPRISSRTSAAGTTRTTQNSRLWLHQRYLSKSGGGGGREVGGPKLETRKRKKHDSQTQSFGGQVSLVNQLAATSNHSLQYAASLIPEINNTMP